MKENSGLLDDLIRRSGLESDSSFLQCIHPTPDGFRFEQSMLKGGCMLWLFLSVAMPYWLWRSSPVPWQLALVVVIAMIVGWVALVWDITQKVIITVQPGALSVDRHRFGMRSQKRFSLTAGDLKVYQSGASSGGMMVAYNLRVKGHFRGLGLRLSHREALALKAMIESIVLGSRRE